MKLNEFREYAKSYNVIPVTRKLLADGETPIGVYRKLAKLKPNTFLLESAEHGYLYPIYVLFAIQLAVSKRWKTLKILGLILAGTLPVASIWAERYVVRKYGN